MNALPTLIIDFDSTFIQIETFDAMIEVLNLNAETKNVLTRQIGELTDRAMSGEIGFGEALLLRLQLLKFHTQKIPEVIDYLQQRITPSFLQHQKFFKENAANIYIFSGGFSEIIAPIIAPFGIHSHHIYANHFTVDKEGWVTGVNEKKLLAHDQGKLKQVNLLDIKDAYVVGDGYTDVEMKLSPKVKRVYLFCENVRREKLVPEADKCIYSFTEFLTEIGCPL